MLFDDKFNCWRTSISIIDVDQVKQLISFIRHAKTTNAGFFLIEIVGSDNEQHSSPEYSIKQRLDWSRSGQLLTRHIEHSMITVAVVIHESCSGELAEIALACHKIFINDKAELNFPTGQGDDFPKFGTLHRLQANTPIDRLVRDPALIEEASGELYKTRNPEEFSSLKELSELISKFADRLEQTSLLVRRMLATCDTHNPTDVNKLDYIETVIYCAMGAREHLDRVEFHPTGKVDSSGKSVPQGRDDYADYNAPSSYPDDEIRQLNRKSRLEEVDFLLKQTIAPISGRCIELGSGYGYFSSKISRSPDVEEVIALDISMKEMVELGPFMWELLEPDWSKLKLVIADMNKLEDQYGTFDTVIFCASLHHSSDIPRSLEIANKLLKDGGSLILHGEHYYPVFLPPKKVSKSGVPNTIPEFYELLNASGFEPAVFRYALSGGRRPKLRKLIFTQPPFCYINGWFRFASFMMLGSKNKSI